MTLIAKRIDEFERPAESTRLGAGIPFEADTAGTMRSRTDNNAKDRVLYEAETG